MCQYWIKTKTSTFPGKVESKLHGWHLIQHKVAMQTLADWNSVSPRKNPGVSTTPGLTPGISDPLQAVLSL